MSELRFTPAPWVWWTSNSWRRLKRDAAGITTTVLEPFVCRDGHPDCSVTEADMALISAAPELYEALSSPPIPSQYHGQQGFEVERFIEDYAGWRVRARQALAKARGEA